MSEELTPLKALKEIGKIKESGCYINTTVEYKIVETALKDYDNLKLKHISMQDAVLDDFEKLMALEIIKKKKVNVFIFLHSGDLETYNDMVEDNQKLVQEEYDLLRKVLL